MASLDKFGVPIPTGGRRIMGQPKPKNRFRVVLYGFGADGTWGDSGAAICYETNSVDLPKFNIANHELHLFDGMTTYAGKMRWQEMNLTVKDTVDNSPVMAIIQQLQKHRDFNRRMAPRMPGDSYKFEMWIQTLSGEKRPVNMLTQIAEIADKGIAVADAFMNDGDVFGALSDNASELLAGTIDTWVCSGCVLTDVDFGDKEYDESNFNTISLSIRPDNCVCIDSSGKPMMYAPSSFNIGGALMAGAATALVGGDITAVGSSMNDAAGGFF